MRTRGQTADPQERQKELSSMLEELDYFPFLFVCLVGVLVGLESACLRHDHFSLNKFTV